MAVYEYEIGANAGARVNLETQGVNPPSGIRFNTTAVTRVRGDGLAVGDGYPNCAWQFEFLTATMYNIFLTLLGGAESAEVSIKTRKEDKTYQAYATCIMHKPTGEQKIGGWFGVAVRFTRLEV